MPRGLAGGAAPAPCGDGQSAMNDIAMEPACEPDSCDVPSREEQAGAIQAAEEEQPIAAGDQLYIVSTK